MPLRGKPRPARLITRKTAEVCVRLSYSVTVISRFPVNDPGPISRKIAE